MENLLIYTDFERGCGNDFQLLESSGLIIELVKVWMLIVCTTTEWGINVSVCLLPVYIDFVASKVWVKPDYTFVQVNGRIFLFQWIWVKDSVISGDAANPHTLCHCCCVLHLSVTLIQFVSREELQQGRKYYLSFIIRRKHTNIILFIPSLSFASHCPLLVESGSYTDLWASE